MARVAKRKPGRKPAAAGHGEEAQTLKPRKRQVLEKLDENEEEEDDEGDKDDDTLDPKTPSKRKRTADPYDIDSLYDVPVDEEKNKENSRQNGRRPEAVPAAVSQPEISPVKKRGPGRPRKHPVISEDAPKAVGTPSKPRRTATFATPTKPAASAAVTPRRHAAENTPMRRTLADRSARRKSTRALISRVVAGGDDDDEDEALEDRIFGGEEEEEEEEEEEADEAEEAEEPETEHTEAEKPQEPADAVPVQPTPRRRGRPPKVRKEGDAAAAVATGPTGDIPIRRRPGRPRKEHAVREPSPPRDLPAQEHYFFQHNRPGAAKTSNNTLAGLRLLTHEEYFQLQGADDEEQKDAADDVGGDSGGGHAAEVRFLEDLHAQSFAQWAFEMAQGFGVCLYGYGAKRRVLRAFATALYWGSDRHHRIVMASGWAAGSGATGGSASLSASAALLRDILGAVAAAADDGNEEGLPVAVPAAEKALLARLDRAASPITLILDGIDAPALRRPAAQATLARVAAHGRVRLLCAADTPGFALLWDGAARAALNLVFHDATTFRGACDRHHGPDVVDEVHALLGRRVRRVGGKDGAAFVLRSLPENARNLFQLLVAEALAAGGDDGGGRPAKRGRRGDDSDDDDDDDDDGRFEDGAESAGLEYRMLYNKAVEEFICSSEMAFRTLLKEFHDHQMVTSRKDAFGTEMLSLPFRRDELEALLEDLMA